MSKKRLFLIIIFCVIFLPILLLMYYSYQTSSQYKETPPLKISADSIKSMIISLIQQEEYFVGSVKVEFVDIAHSKDLDKAEITIRNNAGSDDSVGATESILIAEKNGQTWTITKEKAHWKCSRDFPFVFWTTKLCS